MGASVLMTTDATAAARALAARRRQASGTCERCGTPFAGTASGSPRRYCSPRCRQAAYVQRQRAQWQIKHRPGDEPGR